MDDEISRVTSVTTNANKARVRAPIGYALNLYQYALITNEFNKDAYTSYLYIFNIFTANDLLLIQFTFTY
jgi:hypothetical protein